MAYNKNEREMFAEYLEKKHGYTKSETQELDAWMKNEYGESWTKQETHSAPVKKSRWVRFKEWAAYVWSGKKPQQEKHESEYDQYKEKLQTLTEEKDRLEYELTNPLEPHWEVIPETKPKKGLTDRQKKLLMILACVAVVVLALHVHRKFIKRR